MVDVPINWGANRNRQTKVLDTWKAIQMSLPRQESVKTGALAAILLDAKHYRLSDRIG